MKKLISLLLVLIFFLSCKNDNQTIKDYHVDKNKISNKDWLIIKEGVETLLPIDNISGNRTTLSDFVVVKECDHPKWYFADTLNMTRLENEFYLKNEKNQGFNLFTEDFESLTLITSKKIDSIRNLTSDPGVFWDEFNKEFHGKGYIELSIPILNVKRDTLFYCFSFASNARSGRRYKVWMQKRENEKWFVFKHQVVSTL